MSFSAKFINSFILRKEMVKKDDSFVEMKKQYEKLRKKYKLPIFKELDENFDIGRVSEKDTNTLLREIRKSLIDKVIAYFKFIEMMINPGNSSLFFFSLVKGLASKEKRVLERLYEKLGEMEIDVIELDARYSEKDEAEFIKKVNKEWKTVSEELIKLVEVLRRNWRQKSSKNDRGYFG
jgi:hypothetical protein